MKLLLLTTLVLFVPFQQTAEREEPDITVVKFSWSRFRQNSDLIHSVADPGPSMNEPVSLKPPSSKNEPSEIRNKRDIQERRAEMANAEHNAKTPPRQQDYYLMRLEVKNAGENTIKSIVWEFQPTVQPADYELKQFICKVKAKPKESKTFELLSPFSPVKVVSADKKAQEGKVVINRIEYADGSIWKRKGWSVLIPAQLTEQMGNGKCMLF